MVRNPRWPRGEDENESRMQLSFLVCSLALFALSVIQFSLGLFVSLGLRIFPR